MVSLTRRVVGAAAARSRIAESVFADESNSMRLGRIDLQPHQTSAVKRLMAAITEFGGALLCDPVGTGKTYVALALAAANERALIVAPAILKSMWQAASRAADRNADFISFESLSRGATTSNDFDFLIVDEAHHARNPSTRRFAILSELASSRKVVLLTATPIHNRRRDLASLLSLFLGSKANSLSSAEIARCVVRRANLSASIDMPETSDLIWYRIAEDSTIPSLLLALPPPLPPKDGGDGGALVVHSLIHQWCSSDRALIGGLKRRLVRAEGLIAALDDGTYPSKAELESWVSGDDSVQLAFSELLASPAPGSQSLLPIVQRHRDEVARVLVAARAQRADDDRASIIRQLRRSHSDRKIVVFSQYSDTIDGMFELLAPDGGVVALTGSGARVSGGTISRADAIARFAPVANERPTPPQGEAVSMLLATDLMSEGVNLQDAGVVIHLDLPWTPARMEQRLGRIARIGSPHERVVSYAFHPPASASERVRIEEVLKHKLRESRIVTESLPSLSIWAPRIDPADNSPMSAEALRRVLAKWLSNSGRPGDSTPIAAGTRSEVPGFLALIHSSDGLRLIASADGEIGDDLTLLLACTARCEGPDADVSPSEIVAADHRLEEWLKSESALIAARVSSGHRRDAGRHTLKRIDHIVRHLRPHQRSLVAAKAQRARNVVCGRLTAYQERELDALDEENDAIWLDRVIGLAGGRCATSRNHGVIASAIIVFRK